MTPKKWPMGRIRTQAQPTRLRTKVFSEFSGNKVGPEYGHVFSGNGWDGIGAHWRSRHEHIMPYEAAWTLPSSGNHGNNVSIRRAT